MLGFTSVMTGVMSPPLDCCAVTDTGTICSAGGHQPITDQDRRHQTNHRPGHAALPSDPGSHVRRGWRPMSQSNVDIIMYLRQGACGKGKLRPFSHWWFVEVKYLGLGYLITSSTLRGTWSWNPKYIFMFLLPSPSPSAWPSHQSWSTQVQIKPKTVNHHQFHFQTLFS